MRPWRQTLATLVAAGVAGLLLWFLPHFDRWSTGGYWSMIGVLVAAGLLIGLSQFRNRESSRASFLTAVLPVLVAGGWVVLAAQSRPNWIRDHVLTWSGSLGIDHPVHNLGEHVAPLAFGVGIILGLSFEPAMLRRRAPKIDTTTAAAPSTVTPVAGEPLILAASPAEEVEADEQRLTAPRV